MARPRKARYYRATESFVVTKDGIADDSVPEDERYSADHDYVKRYPQFFEPVETFGRGDVEKATAAPGEVREAF